MSPFEMDMKKRRHARLLTDFEKKAREDYFKSEINLDLEQDNSALIALFYRLSSLIADSQYADEKHKKIFANQIETLTASTPKIRNCYKTIDGKKQDLATIALEMGSVKWAVYMINGEHTETRLERERFNEQESRYGERDIFDEDYEPKYQKTDRQKELLFLMYGSKGKSFLPDHPLITMFTQEFEISPHSIIQLKTDDKTTLKTTPFMYFLQNNYYSETDPIVPQYSTTDFYKKANFDFENFDGDKLENAFLKANLYNLLGDYYTHKPINPNPVSQVTQSTTKAPEKEEDLFSLFSKQETQIQKHPQKTVTNHSESLFPMDEIETKNEKNTQPEKPVVVTHRKKDTQTPCLPGFDFQRD